jgi:shikimate dehydrogenase
MIRAAVLGANVSKSRSPAIHNAAYKALGVDGKFDAISVDAAGFRGLVKRLGREGYAYVNVTIPHKRAAAMLADRQSRLVKSMAASNTLIFHRSRTGKVTVQSENTDGFGLMAALADAGLQLGPGHNVVLLGSGGAAAGGLAALIASGATVRIVARRLPVARALKRRFPARVQTRIEVVPWTPTAVATALADAVAVISSVPAEVFSEPGATAGLEALPKKAVVLEMAYGGTTPLANFFKSIGAGRRYQDGIPMLVHQASRTVEMVVGRRPPIPPLMRAARRAFSTPTRAATLRPEAGMMPAR